MTHTTKGLFWIANLFFLLAGLSLGSQHWVTGITALVGGSVAASFHRYRRRIERSLAQIDTTLRRITPPCPFVFMDQGEACKRLEGHLRLGQPHLRGDGREYMPLLSPEQTNG